MKLLNCSSLLLLLATSPLQAWIQFLDGSSLPTAPWIAYQDGPADGRGDTVVVNFVDPVGGTNNQALRVNSGPGSVQWYIGPLNVPEVVAAARFRLVSFSPTGRENLLCVQVGGGGTHAPSVSITLVDGRYKIWAYTFGEFGATNSGLEIQDIGPVTSNQFHTAYIYCRQDGSTKVWWDGQMIYDAIPISLGGYDGYIEWGSGSWQFNATDVVDFDWVGYGPFRPAAIFNLLTSSQHGSTEWGLAISVQCPYRSGGRSRHKWIGHSGQRPGPDSRLDRWRRGNQSARDTQRPASQLPLSNADPGDQPGRKPGPLPGRV